VLFGRSRLGWSQGSLLILRGHQGNSINRERESGPAMRPVTIPSDVVSALGEEDVFGRRRIRRDRVSSSNQISRHSGETGTPLTESIVYPVRHSYREETTAQSGVQARQAFLLDRLGDSLLDRL